jgi:hypothetical protein
MSIESFVSIGPIESEFCDAIDTTDPTDAIDVVT